MTHQDLLDKYVSSELSVIGEFSGNFLADWRELVKEVETYATEQGLSDDCLNETRQQIADAEICEC